MARRPKIKITITEQVRPTPCHRGHKVGQTYDFDAERGKICPLIMHVLFPAIDILRYGGSFPWSDDPHKAAFACPDPKTLLVFEIEKTEQDG